MALQYNWILMVLWALCLYHDLTIKHFAIKPFSDDILPYPVRFIGVQGRYLWGQIWGKSVVQIPRVSRVVWNWNGKNDDTMSQLLFFFGSIWYKKSHWVMLVMIWNAFAVESCVCLLKIAAFSCRSSCEWTFCCRGLEWLWSRLMLKQCKYMSLPYRSIIFDLQHLVN